MNVNFMWSIVCMLGECTTSVPPVRLLIFDVNGVMIKRWYGRPPSNISPDVKLHRIDRHIVSLRPGLIEFLAEVGSYYAIGCWSSMTRRNMMPIVSLIEDEVCAVDSNFKFQFCFSQDECVQQEGIYHPERINELLFLKPFRVLFERGIEMDSMQTLLIDDAPDKGCLNPVGSLCCVSPYNGDSNDSELLQTLLPYLQRLHAFHGTVPDFSYNCPYEGFIFEVHAEARNTDPIEELLNWIQDEFFEVEDIQSAVRLLRADPAPRTWPEVADKIRMLPSNLAEEISRRLRFNTYFSW